MIDGYGTHGHEKEALNLFNQMQKGSVKPNEVIFLSVIAACSHSDLMEEGLYYFESMKENYGLEPAMDHYGAMVDLLGRAGSLVDAWKFIQDMMPVKPGITVLVAMLGACRIHKNVELGEKAADELFELDPNDGAYHVLLANMFASAMSKVLFSLLFVVSINVMVLDTECDLARAVLDRLLEKERM